MCGVSHFRMGVLLGIPGERKKFRNEHLTDMEHRRRDEVTLPGLATSLTQMIGVIVTWENSSALTQSHWHLSHNAVAAPWEVLREKIDARTDFNCTTTVESVNDGQIQTGTTDHE